MQIKNYLWLDVFLTALFAGSVAARLHGHDHTHYKIRNVEKRNTTSGFGGVTAPTGSGDTYCGNVGSPYGSNMIEITEDELADYNYTITLDGSFIQQEYTAYFWNNCDQDGQLAGFFDTNFPLTVTVATGGKAYVAIDVDSQGAFVGSPTAVGVPRDPSDGIVTGFWGEWDFDNTANGGWSGFDVSALVAVNSGNTDYPGLALVGNGVTSYITNDLGSAENAYSESSEANTGGIGANLPPGPVAITAYLAYNGQSV